MIYKYILNTLKLEFRIFNGFIGEFVLGIVLINQ